MADVLPEVKAVKCQADFPYSIIGSSKEWESMPDDGREQTVKEADRRASSILFGQVKQLEEHCKRVGELVDQARRRFEQDYTGAVAGFSAVAIGGSIAGSIFGVAAAVSVAGIIVGGVGLLASMICRHLNQRNQVNFVREMTELERERSRFAQRAAVLEEIWLHGLPEGMPLAQLQVLLGDRPTALDLDLQCKALPAPHVENNNRSEYDGNQTGSSAVRPK